MNRYFSYIVITLTFFVSWNIRADQILTGFHINSTGNNKYECKIKANFLGMQQVLIIAADKIGIKNAKFSDIPYSELSKIFKLDKIITEESYEGLYSAEVSYRYSNFGVNQLLMRYGDANVQKQFINYVVIPVFKQKNVLYLVDQDTEWSNVWLDNTRQAKRRGLLPIDPSMKSKDIKVGNLMEYSYSDFLDRLDIKNFKNVLIVVCEYFTKDNGDSFFKLTTNEVTPNAKKSSEKIYNIPNPNNAVKYFNDAVHSVIQRFASGSSSDNDAISFSSQKVMGVHGDIDAILDEPENEVDLTKITMQLQVFDNKDIAVIKSKLDKISDVAKYQINLDDNNKYRIELHIKNSLESLAMAYYLNGLSFSEYNGEYVMFSQEMDEGV